VIDPLFPGFVLFRVARPVFAEFVQSQGTTRYCQQSAVTLRSDLLPLPLPPSSHLSEAPGAQPLRLKSMRLYLVRHGQSEGNLGSPRSDPPLTETGRRQASLVADRLSREGIETLLCSPLLRSIETALIISKEIGVHPAILPDLMESWNGAEATPASEIAARFPDLHVNIPERWWPGPEDEEDLYERARRVERRIRSMGEDKDENVVAVSHGTFGAVLISTFLGAPPCGYTRFSQHNCCISVLDIHPGRAKLYRGNDVCHLPPELLT